MTNKPECAWNLTDLAAVPQNGITVMSTFACGGGSSMGYKRAGCSIVAANDIDPEMAWHYQHNLHPPLYYLCPIRDLLTAQLPDELFALDILDGSPPCFVAATPVLTSNGYVPIEQIQVGDYVFTHKLNWKRVTNTMQREAPTVLVDGRIGCTEDHPFLTRCKQKSKLGIQSWTPAKDVHKLHGATTSYIAPVPLPDAPKGFEHSADFWWVVGRWIGDGWLRVTSGSTDSQRTRKEQHGSPVPCCICGKHSRRHARHKKFYTNYCSESHRQQWKRQRERPRSEVLICCGKHEQVELRERLQRLHVAISENEERTTQRFSISRKSLALWLKQHFGTGAGEKTLPAFVYSLPGTLRTALLHGYLSADGYREKETTYRATTVSRCLSASIDALAKTLGYTTCVVMRQPQISMIEGRVCNMRASYSVGLTKNDGRYTETEDGILWRRIRRLVVPTGNVERVYDLTVEDDHSFVADGYFVHNCSTFSMAGSREKAWGKEKHFREGQAKQVLSDLFFDYLDLVERLKPKVAIAENVKGMLLGNAKGYTKMVMARFKEIGYRPQLFLVNAADCGVPQKRERVFFCAIRNDIERPLLKLAPTHRWISALEAISDIRIDLDGWRMVTASNQRHTLAGRIKPWNLSNPSPTLVAKSGNELIKDGNFKTWTFADCKRLGSFPDDYYAKTDKIGKYMIGMSVPPKMTEQVARAVIEQWLKKQ